MENNVENAIEMGAEILEDIPTVHVEGKHTAAIVIGASVLTLGVAAGVYFVRKAIRKKKGVIDGEFDVEFKNEEK